MSHVVDATTVLRMARISRASLLVRRNPALYVASHWLEQRLSSPMMAERITANALFVVCVIQFCSRQTTTLLNFRQVQLSVVKHAVNYLYDHPSLLLFIPTQKNNSLTSLIYINHLSLRVKTRIITIVSIWQCQVIIMEQKKKASVPSLWWQKRTRKKQNKCRMLNDIW